MGADGALAVDACPSASAPCYRPPHAVRSYHLWFGTGTDGPNNCVSDRPGSIRICEEERRVGRQGRAGRHGTLGTVCAIGRSPSNPTTDRRLIEMSNLIRRSTEAAILLILYSKSRIEISVFVLADDGGRLCAGINAATLALVDAGIPLRDMVWRAGRVRTGATLSLST